MFVTYALYSKKYNKIYIGYTTDLIDRFYSHNIHSTKGYTKNFRPWIVVYVEFHELKSTAMHVKNNSNPAEEEILLGNKLSSSGSYPSADGRTFESCPRYKGKASQK